MKSFKIKSGIALKPKVTTQEQQDIKLKQAAKMYEKQFLREIMKAMRSTVSPSELSKPGFAEKIYRGQLDNQYAEKWGNTGGIGLSELIFKQIKARFGSQPGVNQPKGPIPIRKGPKFIENNNNMMKLDIKKTDKDLSFIVPTKNLQSNELTSPWDGVVKNTFKDNMKQVVEIEHDIGLTSLMSFSGELDEKVRKGEEIFAGHSLGQLSNLRDNLYWKLASRKKLG